jgi:hypothetical protein
MLLLYIYNLIREFKVILKRVVIISVGEELLLKERQFLIEIFINRERSFTFN